MQKNHKKFHPTDDYYDEKRHGQTPGADLRDIFAGQVMIATLTHEKNMVCLGGGDKKQIAAMAEDAYEMADAMLVARGK